MTQDFLSVYHLYLSFYISHKIRYALQTYSAIIRACMGIGDYDTCKKAIQTRRPETVSWSASSRRPGKPSTPRSPVMAQDLQP